MTLSVKEMPLQDFLRTLCAQHNVSAVWADGLDRRLVSCEHLDTPISEVFVSLSRRFGVSAERIGKAWYVGEFRDDDKATLVRRSVRLSREDTRLALAVVIGDSGRAEVFADGLVVASDRVGNLRRVNAALDDIAEAASGAWVVQLYLVSTSKTANKDLGLDTQALVDLSYTFAKDSLIPAPANGLHLAGRLSAVLKATSDREDVRMIGKPLFVLGDGESSNVNSGLSVPVPRKTVSDQGTVTTSGFEYVQSGVSATASIRDVGRGQVRLGLKVSLGQITGYVEGAPIQAKDEFNTVAVLASSGVYLLGALDRDESRGSSSGVHERVHLRRQENTRQSQIQVWARLYRIGGAL